MAVKVGINGFGRIGRLDLRAAWGWEELDFVHINGIKGGAIAAAHLLKFDSVHGRWSPEVTADGDKIIIEDSHQKKVLSFSEEATPGEVPWDDLGVEIVLECSGKFLTIDALSTMVVDETQVKILAWYDNEWGYSNRMVELTRKVARLL